LIHRIKQLLTKSEFGKNLLTLGSGTVLAQILPFLFYPIIARVFTPAEFGLLATLTAIFTIMSNFASGRYELGILVAKTKQDAVNLIGLTILLSFVVLTFLYIVLQLFFADILSETLHEPQLKKWLFICPLSAFALIVYNTYNEWCVRNGYFKKLAINKITNASAITLSKLFLGLVKIFSQGLVIGDLVGRIISAGACVFRALQKDALAFKEISIAQIKKVAKEFNEFPKYIMPGRFLNEIGKQLPILFLGFYFNSVEVGYFSMTLLVVYGPVSMISFAVRDLFRQRANVEFINTGSCRTFYVKMFKILSIVAIFGTIILIVLLPSIFSIFVGKQWNTAAYYAQIMTIPALLSLVSIPLFDVVIIANKLKFNFLWQIYYMGITFLSLIVGCVLFNNVVTTLYFLAIGRSSAYMFSIFLSYYFSINKPIREQK
jgi:O-antigen/teichoic acid export membrane protein